MSAFKSTHTSIHVFNIEISSLIISVRDTGDGFYSGAKSAQFPLYTLYATFVYGLHAYCTRISYCKSTR